MIKSQSGFTLIELVVVIVLLGILGATALGKFQDLSGEASKSAVKGVASEISAAASVNYAKSLVGTPAVVINASTTTGIKASGSGTNACSTTNLQKLLATGSFPTGYSTTPNAANCGTLKAGGTYNCVIKDTKHNKTATAVLICTGA